MYIKIEAKYFKAAVTAAAKKDVRYYLNGVYLDKEKSRIIGTDGCRLFIAPAEFTDGTESDVNVIMSLPIKAPIKTDSNVVITVDNGQPVRVEYFNKRGLRESHLVTGIDGQYPDCDRVMASKGDTPVDMVSINPALIADVQKALDAKGCRIHSPVDIGAHLIDFGDPDIHYTVMGLRL